MQVSFLVKFKSGHSQFVTFEKPPGAHPTSTCSANACLQHCAQLRPSDPVNTIESTPGMYGVCLTEPLYDATKHAR